MPLSRAVLRQRAGGEGRECYVVGSVDSLFSAFLQWLAETASPRCCVVLSDRSTARAHLPQNSHVRSLEGQVLPAYWDVKLRTCYAKCVHIGRFVSRGALCWLHAEMKADKRSSPILPVEGSWKQTFMRKMFNPFAFIHKEGKLFSRTTQTFPGHFTFFPIFHAFSRTGKLVFHFPGRVGTM